MSWGGPERYEKGHRTYFVGENETFPSGDKLEYGQLGTVVGPATGEWKGEGVSVQFPGNKGPVNCLFTQVRATPISSSPHAPPTPPHRTAAAAHEESYHDDSE